MVDASSWHTIYRKRPHLRLEGPIPLGLESLQRDALQSDSESYEQTDEVNDVINIADSQDNQSTRTPASAHSRYIVISSDEEA